MTRSIDSLRARLRALFRRARVERELNDELAYHIARDTDKRIAAGMAPEEARLAALRSFGGVEQVKEEVRHARGVALIEQTWQDLRYGARILRKNPGFAAVAIVTLALGIGASTAVFSVVNAVLLRPLPLAQPERLVRIWETTPQTDSFSSSDPNFLDWRASNSVFEQMTAWRGGNLALLEGEPEQLFTLFVTPEFFSFHGFQPMLGRTFTDDENRPGAGDLVVILRHSLWKTRFGSDPSIIGRTINLAGQAYTVVGVLPESFSFGTAQLYVPLRPDPNSSRGNHTLSVSARLKPGVTLDQASAEIKTIAARLSQQYPESNAEWGVRLQSYHDWLIGPEFERMIWILMGAVLFVLLIACGNTANLLLARATARRREMAIRLAVGSTRARMARQLLTESVLLALIGGAVGLLLAQWGVRALRAAEPANLPRFDEISLDGGVLAAALLASFASAIIFGLAPAVQSRISRLHDCLKSAGRLSGSVARSGRTRDVLVVGEVALALVLLIAAGLMARSYWRLSQVDTGFRTERLLMLQISPAVQRYPGEKLGAFYDEVLRRLQSLPGVEAVGGVNVAPLVGGSTNIPFTIPGRAQQSNEFMAANWRAVSPGLFNAGGIPLLKGRLLDDGDARAGAALRLVINRNMAERWWRDQDPIGQSILLQGGRNTAEIVGIVGDVRDADIADDVQPTMYLHHAKVGWPSMTLLVRAAVPPGTLEKPIREQVWSVDKEVPVRSLGTIDDALYSSLAQPRFSASLLAIFSGLALLLAVVGVYGLLAYAVAQRTQEIGVRIAIGAQQSDILGMVLRRGLALIAVGIALGGVLALGLTRVMSTVLFGVGAADPLTFSAVAMLLGFVGVLAILIPARRAAHLDPLVALRYE